MDRRVAFVCRTLRFLPSLSKKDQGRLFIKLGKTGTVHNGYCPTINITILCEDVQL